MTRASFHIWLQNTIIYDQLEFNLVLMIRKQIKCIKIMRNISYTNNFPVLKT